MVRFVAGLAAALFLVGCAGPPPTPSSASTPRPTPVASPIPTPVATAVVTCVAFSGPLPSVLAGDPCPSAVAAFRKLASASGLPIARMVIEPDFFACGQPWPNVASPPVCYGAFLAPGTAMHGWVAFIGSDGVDAIGLVRSVPKGSVATSPPPWQANSLALAVPPAGWVIPSP